jgi:hypothetical protein
VQIAEEVSVGHLEELMAHEHHHSFDVSSNGKVLFIPLVKVAIALVDKLYFAKSQFVFVLWLWWVDFVPKTNVEQVQVVICEQCNSWDSEVPHLSLHESEVKLSPNCKTVSNSSHGIERKQNAMLLVDIFRAVLSSNSNYKRKDEQNHAREVNDRKLTCRLALCSFEVCSEAFRTGSNTCEVVEKKGRHANFAHLLVFQLADQAATDATKASLVLFICNGLRRTLFKAASSKVVLLIVVWSLQTRLAASYFMSACCARTLAASANAIDRCKPIRAECKALVVIK